MRELVCIVCPRGCHLKIDDSLNVTGNACPRGEAYARAETTHPTRVVTSTVRLVGGQIPRLPVKTGAPVPKELIGSVMAELSRVTVTAPVKVGDVVISDVLGTGADVVATREIPETVKI